MSNVVKTNMKAKVMEIIEKGLEDGVSASEGHFFYFIHDDFRVIVHTFRFDDGVRVMFADPWWNSYFRQLFPSSQIEFSIPISRGSRRFRVCIRRTSSSGGIVRFYYGKTLLKEVPFEIKEEVK